MTVPELPRVEQTFTADVTDYVAKMEELVAANQEFIDSVDDAMGKLEEFRVALDSLPDEKNIRIDLNEDDILEQVAYIREVLGGIPDHKNVTVTTKTTGEGTAPGNLDQRLLDSYLAEVAKAEAYISDFSDSDKVLAQTADVVTRSMAAQAAAMKTLESVTADADGTIKQASTSAQTYHSWWGVLQHDVQLWGGALAGVDATLVSHVAAWHIVLDSLLEATIAVTGAVIALGAAFIALEPAGQDIYNRLKAINTVSDATGQSIPPLTGRSPGPSDRHGPPRDRTVRGGS